MTKLERRAYFRQWRLKNLARCQKYARNYYLKNRDKMTAAMKVWRERNPDYEKNWERARAIEVRESKRSWAKRNPNYFTRYRKRNPEKTLAYALTNYALTTGKLIRPATCSKCGKSCKPQKHHEDYSKPMLVIWLCIPCHLAKHGKSLRSYFAGSGDSIHLLAGFRGGLIPSPTAPI
jgi:hypothetical protein